ncbi:MAG: hypothetical protein ACLU38_02165 [Dysosmobacter sp.]
MENARCAVPVRREQDFSPLPDLDCTADTPALTVSVTTWAQAEALLLLAPARIDLPLELLAERDAPAGLRRRVVRHSSPCLAGPK